MLFNIYSFQTGIARGKNFVVLFLENIVEEAQDFPLQLFVTASQDVQVNVSTPKFGSDGTSVVKRSVSATSVAKEGISVVSRNVSAGTVAKFEIDPNMRLTGTAKGNKGILVESSADIVVFGVNMEAYSNDGFLAIPTDSLGVDYYAVCYTPATRNCVIGVAATQNDTELVIQFPSSRNDIDVTYDGKSYTNGDVLVVLLEQHETFQLKTRGDLTGTRVSSNKPFAMFSGNVRTSTEGRPSRDHLVEQIPPTTTWGTQFVTLPIPGRSVADGSGGTVGDFFRIVARKNNTEVKVSGDSTLALFDQSFTLSAGQFRELDVDSDKYLHIESNNPILVVQIAKSQRGQYPTTPDTGDPAMIIIPPTQQFDSEYTFLTPTYSGVSDDSDYTNNFMLAIRKNDTSGLIYDGENLESQYQLQWVDIADTEFVGTVFKINSSQSHSIEHVSDAPFMGLMYGYADREAYGFPVGMKLETFVSNTHLCIKQIDKHLHYSHNPYHNIIIQKLLSVYICFFLATVQFNWSAKCNA